MPCPAITVSPASIPDGDVGSSAIQTISASGGVAPYTFAVSSGSLPPGASLNGGSGSITGTYTTAGIYNFTITATDQNGCPGSRAYTVTISLVMEILIGVVQSSSTSTAGVIKTLAGVIINYSDSTLPTRGIALTLGEYVIFAYDSIGFTTASVTPLTSTYLQGLVDANAGHEITAASILRNLQINNCCASYKGAKWIEKQEEEIPCDNLLDDAQMMTALIDSILGFVPEGEIISGNQATYMITVTSSAGTKAVTLAIGTATYSFNSATSTAATFATDIALNINNKYPQNYPYYAEASGGNVIISGSDFDASNGVAVSGSTTNGTITFSTPNALAGGTASVLQGENGISNHQVQLILNKLDRLCSTSCLNVVNFESE